MPIGSKGFHVCATIAVVVDAAASVTVIIVFVVVHIRMLEFRIFVTSCCNRAAREANPVF